MLERCNIYQGGKEGLIEMTHEKKNLCEVRKQARRIVRLGRVEGVKLDS